MAYNEKHLAKLADLKALGTKQKEVADALAARVDTLENVGSQANVLEGVKVNGTALAIANKMVDILIATGSKNGSISVNGADVAIKGLAALAFKANLLRTQILRFNDELIDDKHHTREHFIEILAIIDAYEDYCRSHPDYKNNRCICAVANIKRVYNERLQKHDFS